jgi:two-component system, cell cycle sensor histidine kinase and response regulator CckA
MPRSLRVLVVDDSGRDLAMLHQVLQRGGYAPALTAVSALPRLGAALADQPWDLVVADDDVPGVPVLEALRVVHASGRDLPVIVLTTATDEARITEWLDAGASGCLAKTQLSRIVPAVRRELWAADLRREHQGASEALRASEQRYRELFEHARDMVFTLDLEGRVTSVNRAGEALIGYSRPEALRLRLSNLLAPEDAGLVSALVRLADSAAPRLLTATFVAKDGRRVPVEISWRPLLREGRVAGAEGIARDLTERRRLETELQHAQRMQAVGRLAGGIAHDFNNLLTAVTGYSELLLERLAADDPLRQTADEIRSAAERAAGLTRQLLAFSRVQHPAPSVVDLNDVVADVQRLLERLIGADVEFSCALTDQPLPVQGDRGQLEQVLMNLVVNARDAMPEGGRLEIVTARERVAAYEEGPHPGVASGEWALLEVRDTGCGMPPEVMARLFEPFFTTKDPSRGTGLGLSTVYGIVTRGKGHVFVDSTPGQGTRFRVLLPLAEQATAAAGPRGSAGALPRGTETLLLVEDETGVRELIRDFLLRCGYEVLEAGGVQQALELFGEHGARVALLITDIVMPQMNGRVLAERLRAERPDLKVLYISGYTDELWLTPNSGSPAAFLQKPFTPLVLARKVREVIEGGPGPRETTRAAKG